MRLTLKSEYGLLALIHLARNGSKDGYVPISAIAESENISPKFLEQILLTLKRARYLRSSKGRQGGYCLAMPADRISLAGIVRALDGPLAPTESVSRYFYEATPVEREKKLLKVMRDIRDMVSDKLEGTTLKDVC